MTGRKPTPEEIAEADKAQEICFQMTRANWMRPDLVPCEVCGGPHCNWECCDCCNYDRHVCVACGDNLGHKQISACYILNRIEFPPNSD